MCREGADREEGGPAPPVGRVVRKLIWGVRERETFTKMGLRGRLGAEPWLMGIPGPRWGGY